MAYTEISNQTSLSQLFVYVATEVPIFIPMLLTALFLIVSLGTHFSQIRSRGYANWWASIAVAGYVIAVTSSIMSLIPNLINPFVVMVCIVIAVVGTAMFLTSSND